MGLIAREAKPAYVSAAEAVLLEVGIPLFVQPSSGGGDGSLLAVPNLKHDLALKILKEAELDPAQADDDDRW